MSHNWNILKMLLRPVSSERMAEIGREQTGPNSLGEQLTLADAGLEDEVHEILAKRLVNFSDGNCGVLPMKRDTSACWSDPYSRLYPNPGDF